MALNLTDLDRVREAMLAEVEHDIAAGVLYRSARLTDTGWSAYPDILKKAISSGDDAMLTASLQDPRYWLDQEQSRSSKGKVFCRTPNQVATASECGFEFSTGCGTAALGRAS